MANEKRGNNFFFSLTPHEKQYISKRSSLFHKDRDNKYMEIFDIITSISGISDDKARGMLSGNITPNNYAVAKKYLLQFSCEALADYYKNTDYEINLLREVEILIMLMRKGQYELCLKLWKNLTKRARKLENYPILLHLQEIYQQLTLYFQTDYSLIEMEETLEEFQAIQEQYQQFQELKKLYSIITIMRKKAHYRLSVGQVAELQQILKRMDRFHHLSGEEYFLYNHYYHITLGTTLYLLGNLELAFPILRENVTRWQKNYIRVQHDNGNYLEAVYVFNYVAVLCNEYEDIYAVLANLVNEHINGPQNKAFFDFIQHNVLNRIFNRTAQYDQVELLLPVMEESLETYQHVLLTEHKRVMLLSMGIAYFALGKLADAYNKLYIVRTHFHDKTRVDQVSFAYLFILLISFEMNDDTIFRSEYNNTYQYFYSRVKPEVFEREIISALNRAFNLPRAQQNVIFQSLMDKLEKTEDNIIQQQVFQIFNFPNWVSSKIAGISYREYRMKELEKI